MMSDMRRDRRAARLILVAAAAVFSFGCRTPGWTVLSFNGTDTPYFVRMSIDGVSSDFSMRLDADNFGRLLYRGTGPPREALAQILDPATCEVVWQISLPTDDHVWLTITYQGPDVSAEDPDEMLRPDATPPIPEACVPKPSN
jgi:hypothetical protein